MKHLIIIGARGFGREVYNSAIESIGYGIEFDVIGFLDDKKNALENFEGYPPIISSVEDYIPQKDDIFICALGEVKWKKYYTQLILKKGGTFFSLIHKDAYISKNVKFGTGCIFLAGSRVHCDVSIDDFVVVQPYAIIGHDVRIGKWCHINAYADCGGGSRLGSEVTLHTHSFVLPKCNVGDGVTLGACSVIITDVESNKTLFGVPARNILPSNKNN